MLTYLGPIIKKGCNNKLSYQCNFEPRLKRLIIYLLFSIGINLTLFSVSSNAAQTSPIDCDSLAGHPSDKSNPNRSMGVKFTDLNAPLAIKACEQAVNQNPNEPRYAFQLGRAFHKHQDYENAFKYYSEAANDGYANAQSSLGGLYREGKGVPQSYIKAAQWYRKAANQGFAEAQYQLGNLYLMGQDVSQTSNEAANWLLKASNQGHNKAQRSLGWMYKNSYDISQSQEKAAEWYLKSALQGNAVAQASLGAMYEEGRGVTQSDDKAFFWFRKSAEQGFIDAQASLGWMYRDGRGVEQSDSEALMWYKKVAERRAWDKAPLYNEPDKSKIILPALRFTYTSQRGFYEVRCSHTEQPNKYYYGAILKNSDQFGQEYYAYLGQTMSTTPVDESVSMSNVVDKLCKTYGLGKQS